MMGKRYRNGEPAIMEVSPYITRHFVQLWWKSEWKRYL